MIKSDWQLVRDFLEQNDQRAFEQLVSRHVNFVFSAALRQTGDYGVAEDVTQAVFILLARKSSSFTSNVVIPAWLYRATRIIAKAALRVEAARQRNDREANQMQLNEPNDPLWNELAPHLDNALEQLREVDRKAILLRYFANQSFREVAGALRVSEDAAKKRVQRALEELRGLLNRKGVSISAAALGALLLGSGVQAAPSAFSAVATSRALGHGAAVSASITELVTEGARSFFWEQFRTTTLVATAAIVILSASLYVVFREHRFSASGARTLAAMEVTHDAQAANELLPPNPAEAVSQATPRQLLLNVVDAVDGTVLRRAQVRATFYGPKYDRVDQWTDKTGKCLLEFPKKLFDGLTVWVFAPGHVGKSVAWNRAEDLSMPAEYAVKLERGMALSGIVQDEDGSPIPSAKINLARSGMNLTLRENVDFLYDVAFAESDLAGRWTCDFIPPNLDSVTFYLRHPNYALGEERVRLKEAFGRDLVFTMRGGVEVSGVVVNDDGDPVAGAEIEEDTSTVAPRLSARSAEDGRFILGPVKPGKMKLAVEAVGYRNQKQTVNVERPVMDLSLQLTRSASAGSGLLRGRVLTEGAEPIAGITIQLVNRTKPLPQQLDWQIKTDDQGRFSSDRAPDGVATYSFYTVRYYQPLEDVRLAADGSEHEIVLKRQPVFHLRGTVVDANTQAPVERFTVLSGQSHDEQGMLQFSLLGEGAQGHFDLVYGDEPFRGGWERLQIEAEGYWPEQVKAPAKKVSTGGGGELRLGQWDGDQTFSIELKRSAGFAGRVILADGAPAAGAQVSLGGKGIPVTMQQPGKFMNMSDPRQRLMLTASDGSFCFPPTLDAERVLVAHPAGWANVPLAALENGPVILTSWGRVEGTLLLGDQVGVHQFVNVDPGDWDWQKVLTTFPFVYETKTDENGNFVFTHVPAGKWRICQRHNSVRGLGPVGLSNAIFIDVNPGETTKVVIGGKGAVIVGKLTADPRDATVDWTADVQRLQARDTFAASPASGAPSHEFFCERDGTFRVHNVQPGAYKLIGRVTTRSRQDQDNDDMLGFGPEVGRTEREVIVPESNESPTGSVLDLGVIEIAIKR